MKNIIRMTRRQMIGEIWASDPHLKLLLLHAHTLEKARDCFFEYLNDLERRYFNILSPAKLTARHIIVRDNAKECIRVLRNVIRTENEKLTGFSALKVILDLALDKSRPDASRGFLCEFIFLLKGINATANLSTGSLQNAHGSEENSAAFQSNRLDAYSEQLDSHLKKFKSGRDFLMRRRQEKTKKRILTWFKATERDWQDHKWHLKHIIMDVRTLSALVQLSPDEKDGLVFAEEHGIPFQVTPYYLSLFNSEGKCAEDRGVRMQVLPSLRYCQALANNRAKGVNMDFMGEKMTSPVRGITRRYAQIVILKPFDSCPQICTYCQRNWEITELGKSGVSTASVRRALEWIKRHKTIHEVLITGGDPLTLGNNYLEWLIGRLAAMDHIERIRIGTRTPVTVPCRIDNGFVRILKKYHRPGRREIAIMTHVEYPAEITDEMTATVARIRSAGVSVYNQQVFTYFTSRRYETCFLRKQLKLNGIDPYYTFNTKGKDETMDFRVPISRLEQERHEEARLLPGLARTDEPVFNVPRQGKSSLVAWQDHEPVMIRSDGSRVYRFYPWESKLAMTDDYLYADVPIFDYLTRLHADGEDIRDYMTIWYYF